MTKNILVLTTAETDLITLSSVLRRNDLPVDVTARNLLELDEPVRFIVDRLNSVRAVLLRVVGGAEYLEGNLGVLTEEVRDRDVDLLAVSASGNEDPELRKISTYDPNVVRSVERALRQGGAKNFERVLRSLVSDDTATVTVHEPPLTGSRNSGDHDLALLYYRANYLAGDEEFISEIEAHFRERGLSVNPIFVPGITHDDAMETVDERYLRDEDGNPDVDGVISLLGFGRSSLGEPPSILESLGVPWFQLVVASRTQSSWESSSNGLEPSDLSMKVIFPELDGRLNGPPVAFKDEERYRENIGTSVRPTTGYDEGIRRSARWVDRWLTLASKPNPEKRVAVVLGNHPTSRARIGNGVGLDTPASLMNVLETLREHEYQTGPLPDNAREFMDYLVEKASYGSEGNLPEQPAGFVPGNQYRSWLEQFPDSNREKLLENWDDPSRSERFRGGFAIPGVRMKNVFVGVQPPRGFEEQPGAVYHDPELVPPHLYVAFYRWLTREFEADAIVHLGKHGTLEWLPGKSVVPGKTDWPSLLLEDRPLLYPFIVNDPGEGTQAKRRTGAVIVDHMVAPQRRTDLPEHLEDLADALDRRDSVAVRDELDRHGLGSDRDLDGLSDGELFSLAEDRIEDIRGSDTRSGLHVLGELPEGKKRIDLFQSLWPETDGVPDEELLEQYLDGTLDPDRNQIESLLENMSRVDLELKNLINGLSGKYVPPGPSGAPTDGRPDLLPTGRNFYSRDARGMPTRKAWTVGKELAEQLVKRYRDRHNSYPTSIGLVLWGTANMRTGGEDVAQVLELMGIRPTWTKSGRVDGVEVIPEQQLERPRVDPLVRISGFFRDAFPNLVQLIRKGVSRASEAPARVYPNFLAEHDEGIGDVHPRIFGSRPEHYGAGLLPLIESGNWESDEDLAEAFLEWGKYAYSGEDNPTDRKDLLVKRLRDVDAVTQNRDNREQDLFDSDDYFQFHGGMVAAASAVSERSPDAYVTDTSENTVSVRTLAEESERVFHSRVSHPVWQEGMRDHGYKGGFEMAATVDYVFGYDATTDCVPDRFYERMAEDFVLDETNRSFLEEHNRYGIRDIGERLLEAADRGLWDNSSGKTEARIKSVLRDTETSRESQPAKTGAQP